MIAVLGAGLITTHVWSFFANIIIVTIAFSHLVGFGGAVFYLCHMLHNSDNSEMSTTAAYFVYYGISLLITVCVVNLVTTTASLQALYIIILVFVSLY